MWLRVDCQQFVLIDCHERVFNQPRLETYGTFREWELLKSALHELSEYAGNAGHIDNFLAPELLLGFGRLRLLFSERDESFVQLQGERGRRYVAPAAIGEVIPALRLRDIALRLD